MNKEIEKLYKKLEAQDKIINTQALEIARLKEDKKKAYKYLKEHRMIGKCKEYYELLAILGEKE